MPKPPRPPAPTPAPSPARRRMLDVALDRFHARGIHATSVDEILSLSGTGKSQLYHYFGSKDGLVRAVVEDVEQRLIRGDLPGGAEIETLGDLERWFATFVEFQRYTECERGCPMATIAGGLDASQESTRAAVQRVFDRACGVLERFFVRLRKRGDLPDAVDPSQLADFCYAIMQGGLVVSRVRQDVAPFEHAVAHALRYLRSLVEDGV